LKLSTEREPVLSSAVTAIPKERLTSLPPMHLHDERIITAMPLYSQPAIPLPFPQVAGHGANRVRLLRWTATAATTFTTLIAVLLVSFLSLLLFMG
jgi:hypothetical protein